jgi:hypothetical protein
MQYVLAAAVVAGFAFIISRTWFTRHREAGLRREIRAKSITFRTSVDYIKVMGPGPLEQGREEIVPGFTNQLQLIARGDAFEISSAIPLVRAVLGVEYYFRAHETTVELYRVVPRIYGSDSPARIVVRGWQAGKQIQVVIVKKHDLQAAWDALVSAGVAPGTGWIALAKQA